MAPTPRTLIRAALISSVLITLVPSALAQDATNAPSQQKAGPTDLASLFDEATFGIVGADLALLDPDAFGAWVRPLLTRSDGSAPDADMLREFDAGMQSASADIRSLRDAGAREFWFVLSLKGYPEHAAFIAIRDRDPAGSHQQAIAAWMQSHARDFPASTAMGDLLLFGQPSLTEGLPAPDSPHAQNARKALVTMASDGATIRLLLQPSESTRKAFQELTGDAVLPGVDVPAAPFINGLSAATLSVWLKPEPTTRLVIESPDPRAAEDLGRALQSALEAIGASPKILPGLPLLPPVIKSFRVTTTGAATRLELPPEASTALARAITPGVLEARATAREMDTARRLRSIAQSCVLFEQNSNAWPETLDALVRDSFITAELTRDTEGRQIVYLKPPKDAWQRNPAERVLAYPRYDAWPERGLWVAFIDGHVTKYHRRDEFEAMLDRQSKP